MKTSIAIAMVLSLMVVLGCESPRGGGMSNAEGFTIGTPTLPPTIKQGEDQSVTVSLNRGESFKRDVTLEIRASKGISVNPTKVTIKGNEKPDVQLRVMVPKKADLGAYKIEIKGTPETGEATSTEFTVNVVSP